MVIKREADMMKREERQENVERIARANEHKKLKIFERIQSQSKKGEYIMSEKR